MSEPVFVYGEAEKEYLKSRDKKLGAMIDRIGHVHRRVMPDLFDALVNSIVCQQVSSVAGETVWRRLQQQFDGASPAALAAAAEADVQKCGLTFKKVGYIQNVARQVQEGSLDLQALYALPDEEVIASLVALPGIGKWTAEMLMIFSLQRPDIVSYGDIAILRGMRMTYRHKEITPALFRRYCKRYSPYGSVASLYLWAVSHGVEGVTDPARPNRMPPKNPAIKTTKKQ